uniref:Uncharacterized protein n=1 Tax=Hucho hucho TaxID=62062 RepID=A0A4W5PJ90_9TELE
MPACPRCPVFLTMSAWDCQPVPEIKNLMQIDAGLGQVVATNTSQIPYYLVGDEWIRLPGSLKHITAGPAGILGVYKADSIYKYVAGNWVQVAGKWRALLNISPEDTCFLGPGSPLPWTGMPGSVKYYSCGPFGCWAVNKNDDIYLMSVRSGKECEKWSSVVEDGECQHSSPKLSETKVNGTN